MQILVVFLWQFVSWTCFLAIGLVIAAVILSNVYYLSALFQFNEFDLYWGAVFFYDSRRSIGEVLFKSL